MRTGLKIVPYLVFAALSLFCRMQLNDFFMNTIYTVSGIMFSIGIGLVVTFNLHGIKNKNYIRGIRANLKEVRRSYIWHFLISTVIFVLDKWIRDSGNSIINMQIKSDISIHFNFSVFFGLAMFSSIVYFIVNFLALQKLNDDIFDRAMTEDAS